MLDSKTIAEDHEQLFEPLATVLADSLLVSYLLGIDQLNELTSNASFAEDDDTRGRRTKSKDQKPKIDSSFNLQPDKAIDYFEKKKVVRKKEFDQLSTEAKRASFSVSRVYKDDVLNGFKDEIDSALRTGATQQQTINKFRSILAGASHEQLGEFHLETVFRTNMQTAYGAGRRRGLEDVSDAFPFWQYHAVMDDRTRPRHAAINGIILPADNPFWEEHYPPWGFNCRCAVTPTDEIPPGYDRTRPGGDEDVTLSYNDEGVPVKAAVGTQVVDLTVGNFAGVGRGASLLTAVEVGVKRARKNRRN